MYKINNKVFELKYVDKLTGLQHTEVPRRIISLDGIEHSLVVGNDNRIITLASGDIAITTEDDLWDLARFVLSIIKKQP